MVTRTVCLLQPSHAAYWALTRRVAECVEQRDTCQRLETALSQRSCFAWLAFRDELVISVNKRAFCVFEVASQDQSGAHPACSGTTTPRQVLISKPCNEGRASFIACTPSYSFRSGRICYYPLDLSDRLLLKVSRPRREGSVQAESLCIQLISWLTAFPSLLLSNSGTEFFGITQQVCSIADHVIVSGFSLLSDASHDTSVAVPVDLTSSVCEGSQQNDCNHRQWSRSPTRVQYRSSYAQGWLGLWGSCNSTSEVSIV